MVEFEDGQNRKGGGGGGGGDVEGILGSLQLAASFASKFL